METSGTYHCPVGLAMAYSEDELADEGFAHWRVCYLGVELDAPERFRIMLDSSEGSCFGVSDDMEIGRELRELVTVRHPDLSNKDTVQMYHA